MALLGFTEATVWACETFSSRLRISNFNTELQTLLHAASLQWFQNHTTVKCLSPHALPQIQPWNGGLDYFEIEDMASPRIHSGHRIHFLISINCLRCYHALLELLFTMPNPGHFFDSPWPPWDQFPVQKRSQNNGRHMIQNRKPSSDTDSAWRPLVLNILLFYVPVFGSSKKHCFGGPPTIQKTSLWHLNF